MKFTTVANIYSQAYKRWIQTKSNSASKTLERARKIFNEMRKK